MDETERCADEAERQQGRMCGTKRGNRKIAIGRGDEKKGRKRRRRKVGTNSKAENGSEAVVREKRAWSEKGFKGR